MPEAVKQEMKPEMGGDEMIMLRASIAAVVLVMMVGCKKVIVAPTRPLTLSSSNIVTACMTDEQKDCVDVVCYGRNLVEGCPDWKPKPEPTVWPTVARAQLILDPVQAKYPGNEHAKPCGPDNYDMACYDPNLPHITNRLYSQKENCELNEAVKCAQLATYWVPIGKPVFYDESDPKP